ncbi:helix-turn-helix domain-containing protein [Lactococcus lactis]|uniref:helix-turn-helix domain-containing protein n=2 Tax=Lactococcus lactis TaxID=1358 RepID=UPI0003BA19EF|nr:helix-turn-helix transcriptional regulator [Lactococcus lactis]AGY45426.1 XRE family transcriptional regulator [Lactococcus lactis subsp. lactis KLDS 4.0325]MBG1278216.1 helix-turn-helix transcriptional regulator [Lactococcus lactis subsp. lactis]MCX7531545.1 helix-turn-helix transcriptional regulator [Lactococcus lactis]MDM7474959.1 helix-turn-helix transcriptional regulator [Lactococcus lactis]MDM7509217.1 helix-turn-helix transcriptional regulator [Lactococcus lactis]
MRKNRIKERRKAQTITLKELSEKLKEKGLSFNDSQLYYYEQGKRSPRNEDIWEALAEIFDVSLAYVMGIE